MYLVYFALWIILNGKVTVEICLFGIVIAAAIFAFTCRFLNYSLSKELFFYRKFFTILHFIGVMLREIVKANLAVARLIVTSKEEPEPVLVSFHIDLRKSAVRALFADSITITPGTITASLEGGDYVVHCLDESFAPGLAESDCKKILEKLDEQPKERAQKRFQKRSNEQIQKGREA